MKYQGFTLIELSIVLVIIGLIIGGVITGREQISNAQVRKDIAQWDSYSAAANAYKMKYHYYPGDLPDANILFPGIIWHSNTPWAGMARGDHTINSPRGLWDAYEGIGFFDELYASGLTSFKPSGIGSATDNAPGLAFPGMIRFPDVGFMPFTATRTGISVDGQPLHLMGDGKNWYRVGLGNNNAAGNGHIQNYSNGGIIPADAYAYDAKLDNGRGDTGTVVVMCSNLYDSVIEYRGNPGDTTCMQGGKCMNTDGTYDFTNKNKACGLGIRAGF